MFLTIPEYALYRDSKDAETPLPHPTHCRGVGRMVCVGARAMVWSAFALILGAFIYFAIFVQTGGANDTFVGPSLRVLESVVAASGLVLMIGGAIGLGVSTALFVMSRASSPFTATSCGDVPTTQFYNPHRGHGGPLVDRGAIYPTSSRSTARLASSPAPAPLLPAFKIVGVVRAELADDRAAGGIGRSLGIT
jgi:hypothetical protein